jgi:pimeloyl-ACP methyl ester carboxylesterase
MKVVLLHAFPLDERMWEPQRELLADADVFAPRLYGYGNSMDAWADGILRDAGEGNLVLVGASMGGYAALAIARRAPERARGLLLEGARTDADTDERRRGRADTIQQVQAEGAAGLWRAMAPKLLTENARPETVAAAEEMALAQDPIELIHAVEAIRDRDDLTGVAQAMEGPVLAVVGSKDPFVSAAELREVIGGDHVVEIPDVGHLASLERPEAFNPALRDFLDSFS